MNNQIDAKDIGFSYFIRVRHPDGRPDELEGPFHNLTPIEGCNYLMSAGFKGAAQVLTWYLSVYKGNYTPVPGLTAADYPGTATECTDYESTTRPEWVEGAVVNGALDNSASPAVFTFTQPALIYGGAMHSSSVKGSTNGILGSAVRFTSPKDMAIGSQLEIIAGNTLISN